VAYHKQVGSGEARDDVVTRWRDWSHSAPGQMRLQWHYELLANQ
jgi:hypothetical protein